MNLNNLKVQVGQDQFEGVNLNHLFASAGLPLSKEPNRVGVSHPTPHLRTETDHFQTLCSPFL
jgi:hypothetical protein